MKKVKSIRYYKPNIGALRGKIGLSIIETIKNAHTPDFTELDKQNRERAERIAAARKNETY